MIGVYLLVGLSALYEAWAELFHHETITAGVRSLPLPARLIVALLLVALALHLVTTPQWAARHDPLDRLEHEVVGEDSGPHQWLDRQEGIPHP